MEKPTREFKLNISSVRGVETNTSYPFTLNITCKEDLAKAVAYDHVGAEFADGKNTRGRLIPGYRSRKTFRRATAVLWTATIPNRIRHCQTVRRSNGSVPQIYRKRFPALRFMSCIPATT